MATAVFPHPKPSHSDTSQLSASGAFDTRVDDRHGWGFALLLATTATLFLRPADLIPSLDQWPIYQALILACLVVSARSILRQLSIEKLVTRPVTACLLLLLVAVGASHLSHGFVWAARYSILEVSKLIALYLLIVAVVNTPERLRTFLKCLTLAISTMATLALLDRFGYWSIAALESVRDRGGIEDGLMVHVQRIRGTGIFHDPNDFGLILVTGIVLCTCFFLRPRATLMRYLWAVPGCVLVGALGLTHSRGALLSVIVAIPAVMSFFRGGKFALLSLVAVPPIALGFSSRMTDVGAISQGTGQDRLQIWSASIDVFRSNPIFGLGEGLIADEIGVVTHNSFLHCFAELGAFGGVAFVACFLAAGLGLWHWRSVWQRLKESAKTNRSEVVLNEPHRVGRDVNQELMRQCGYLFAMLVASVVSMLTISRQFVAPTYLILGLVTAANSIAGKQVAITESCGQTKLGNRFLAMSVIVSLISMAAFYGAVRVFVRW